jgi:hypothetical protein
MRIPWMMWSPDDLGSGGSVATTATPPVPTTPEGQPPAVPDGANEGQQPTPESESIQARLERAERSAIQKLLKTLGLDKVDDLTALVTAEKSRREGEMTEVQRVTTALEKANRAYAELQDRYNDLQGQVRKDRVEAAITAAAKDAKRPGDVATWLQAKHSGELDGVIDDTNTVDPKKVAGLVATVRKEQPEWFVAVTPGVPSNASGQPPSTPDAIQDSARVLAQVRKYL